MRRFMYQIVRGNPQTGTEVIIAEVILRSYADEFRRHVEGLEPQYVFWIREIEV